MSKYFAALAIACLLGVSSANAVPIPVVNGSFELDINGDPLPPGVWTSSDNTQQWIRYQNPLGTLESTPFNVLDLPSLFNDPIPDGTHVLNAGGLHVNDVDFTVTTPGTITLNFSAGTRNDVDTGSYVLRTRILNQGGVGGLAILTSSYAGGIVDFTPSNPTAGSWETHSLAVEVTQADINAGLTDLAISFRSLEQGGVYVDDVSLDFEPIPEPSSLALVVVVLCGLIRRYRG